jgi:hypothetical protein
MAEEDAVPPVLLTDRIGPVELPPETALAPSMVWPTVKMLAAFSCGTLVASTFRVTLPPVPPPVRSVPAMTPVPVGATQTHAVPVYCRI